MPPVTTAPVPITAEPYVVLYIERDGSIDLNGQHLRDAAAAKTSLAALFAKSPDRNVVVSAGPHTPYAKIAPVLLMLQSTTAKIGIVAAEP